ncbi:MAG: Crp/Fnr family transcriptional regulator [Cyclobacteriaceae bacterium]|nr:Crp/Fnr family transcriptional regulator [Cyclobacteriaceae bacterium]MCK5368398.1 Crp/Fnr family transcriptional regulator [Cyclobacteriaceae bacterium]MCK5468398.1 Crp/Fnr family transcriptional regulator [Cyclobacteriaceae bacterium]
MIHDQSAINSLAFLEHELKERILEESVFDTFPGDTILIRDGQYLKHLPVIVDGMVKVYSQYDDKELLLYYIKPKQSCIFSFTAAIYNKPSKIFAITEEESKILLLPTKKIGEWAFKFQRFNQLFFDLYHLRYLDLLDTINQLVFKTLDQRILSYLLERSNLTNKTIIPIRHRQIANDLGTAREVVSRVLKKLEKEKKVIQTSEGIKILVSGD